MTSGVLQGPVLGPLCFLVFINDLDDDVSMINILSKFADDTKLGHVVVTEDDRKTVQSALDNLCAWSARWNMNFNTDKCKIMHLGRNNPGFKYTMNETELKV